MKLIDILHIIGDGLRYGRYLTGLTGGTKTLFQIVVTNPGSNYTGAAPAVTITSGGGSGATATAQLLENSVIEIDITAIGSGYTSAPTVTLDAPPAPGTTATANAILAAGTLDAIGTVSIDLALPLIVPIVLSGQLNFYLLRAGTDAEASPQIIRPDDYNGSTNQKVWELIGVQIGALTILPGTNVTAGDGVNIVVGSTTGTKIGTAVSQKLSLFGVTPIVQPAGAAQAAVTMVTVDGAIAALTFSASPTQAECEALRDATETLADDVRNVLALVNAMRTAGVNLGTIKGAA